MPDKRNLPHRTISFGVVMRRVGGVLLVVLLLQVVRAHLIFKGIISNHVTSFQFILTQVGHLFSKTSLNVSFLTSHFIINQLSIISDYFADINYTVWSNSTTGTRTAGMPFHPISLPLLPSSPSPSSCSYF